MVMRNQSQLYNILSTSPQHTGFQTDKLCQNNVGTATYVSELIGAKTATEQIMDLRNTLRYLGVPIVNNAYMIGDNKSVVTSKTIPQSILSKRHNMLSYQRVREAIDAKNLEFYWC